MKKTNYILIFCILIIAILGIILSYTYAFPYESNVYVDKSLTSNPVFVTNTDDLVNFTITSLDGDVLATDESNAIISLSNDENTKTVCTYDMYYNWHPNTDLYVRDNKEISEYSLLGKIDGITVFEKNQVTLVQKQYLFSGSIYSDGGIVQNQTIVVEAKFLNTGLDQTYHLGKTYKGYLSIENVMCKASSQLQAISIVKENTVNGYYEDLDSNNYLYFDNEMYRIIGIYNGKVMIIKSANSKSLEFNYGILTDYPNINNINWLTDEYLENEVYLLNDDVLLIGLGSEDKPYQIVLKTVDK